METYKRPQYGVLLKRLDEDRRFIQVISGPRQVGKTTLIHQLLAGSPLPSTYISADSVFGTGRDWLEGHWEAVRLSSRTSDTGHILAVDEIQKIQGWSTLVKALWDEDTFRNKNIKLILSGSSGLLLDQGLTESLAGRFEMTCLNHWGLSEMKAAFGWSAEMYAWFGGYPGSVALSDDEKRWKAYVREALVEPTISKDILQMTRIDKPVLLRQLFDLGCRYSGEILSYNKMLGKLQDAGNTVTLAGYLKVLGKAGLIEGLEKYSGSFVRQKLSSPKLVVRNTALISSAVSETFKEVINRPETWGRVVESAVGAHLVNNCDIHGIGVYYWREGNDEVDYILTGRNKILGIKVKSGNRQTSKGLARFRKLFPDAKSLMVGREGVPWQDFLLINPEHLFEG